MQLQILEDRVTFSNIGLVSLLGSVDVYGETVGTRLRYSYATYDNLKKDAHALNERVVKDFFKSVEDSLETKKNKLVMKRKRVTGYSFIYPYPFEIERLEKHATVVFTKR